jgi:hypothetical protein
LSAATISARNIEISLHGEGLRFERARLPQAFLEWQSSARLEMFDLLRSQGAQAVRMQPAHLPVLATVGDGPFVINLSTRGVGLLPRPELLDRFTRLFQETLRDVAGLAWEESLDRRLAAVQALYSDVAQLDPSILGGLEIFEGQTLRNLRQNPLASLLYTGQAPRYPSYQFNGVVHLVGEEDPGYRFLLAARELFARDPFHVHQIHYPWGYLFYVVEARDKTPYPRR